MQLSPIVDHDFFINVTPDQHHAEDHKARHQIGGADDLESLLELANFAERAHGSLTGIGPSDHHARYTDLEAVIAAEAEDPFDHAGDVTIGGSLGIGTPTPNELLEVYGASGRATLDPITIRISSSSNGIGWDFANPWACLDFYSADVSSPGATVRARIGVLMENQYGTGGIFAFYTSSDGVQLTERMRINGIGNVGIGTSIPGQKLHIYTTDTGAVPVSVLRIDSRSSNRGGGPSLDFVNRWTGAAGWENWRVASIAGVYGASGVNRGALVFSVDDKDSLGYGVTEKMRLDHNGDLFLTGGGTVASASCVPVAAVKTSTGSVSGTYANLTGGNITFNRKSFFPQLASDNELWILTALAGADPADYVGRIALWNDSGAAVDYWLRWDYLS